MTILIVNDDFSSEQVRRIRQTVAAWADVVRLAQHVGADEYRGRLRTTEIVVGWPRAAWLPGTAVRLVLMGSSGWEEYQHQGLDEAGIALCNGRGVYSIGVAEHAIAMMMALARRIPTYVHDKDQRLFRRHLPHPTELAGSTACVVGLGDIGTEVAKRCKGLAMRVVGVARRSRLPPEAVDSMRVASDEASLADALADADHVFLVMPGAADNVGLISRRVLERLKPTAFLYNLSRGTTVDETALYERLRDGYLAGAGLDVTAREPLPANSPLWELGDNLLLTGHSAGVSQGHAERFCQLVIRNLVNYHEGHPLENRVI